MSVAQYDTFLSMTLIVMLMLWQLVRLFTPSPFNTISRLSVQRAWRRFNVIGAFPVALIRRRVHAPDDEVIHEMGVALVVGVTEDMFGAGVILQITPDLAISVTNARLASAEYVYHMYEIQGMINLSIEQIRAFAVRAEESPPDVGDEEDLPTPVEMPGAPLFFLPEEPAPESEESDEDGNEGSDGGTDEDDYGEQHGEEVHEDDNSNDSDESCSDVESVD